MHLICYAGASLCLIAGVTLAWIALRVTSIQWSPAVCIVVAIACAMFLPGVTRLKKVIHYIQYPSREIRGKIFVILCILAPSIIYAERVIYDRPFYVKFHDEHSYIIQARMLAEGRLWFPAHAVPDSFESMHLLVRPVYSSIYFPGTALVHMPATAMGVPYWIVPLLITGLTVGLLYRVVTELVDGFAGMIAALFPLGLPFFRGISTMVISQPLMLLLVLLMLYLWLKWKSRRSMSWALLIGIVGGLALITRPIEAMAYALPIGIAMLNTMRRDGLRRIVGTVLSLLLPTLPFLALQAVHNIGTTGHLSKFASDLFVERNYPAPMLGFHPIPKGFIPAAKALSIVDSVQAWVISEYRHHNGSVASDWFWRRWPTVAYGSLPNGILLIFASVGVFQLGRKQRWVLFLPLPLTLSFYYFYTFYIVHYAVMVIPAMAIAVGLSPHVIAYHSSIRRTRIFAGALLAISVATISTFQGLGGPSDTYDFRELHSIDQAMSDLPHVPAVVFFTYGLGLNIHSEPVYNIATAQIDDALVVRAHDLGDDENYKLIAYYAVKQPARHVYYYNRVTHILTYRGLVTDIMKSSVPSNDVLRDRN